MRKLRYFIVPNYCKAGNRGQHNLIVFIALQLKKVSADISAVNLSTALNTTENCSRKTLRK